MLHVRPTRPRDVPGILALIGEVYREYGCVLDAEHEDTHLLAPGEYFRSRGGEFWVVVEAAATPGGSAAGAGAAEVVRGTAGVVLHADAGELKSLYVHRSLRRQGWGRRLTQMAIDHARGAGRLRFILWSDTRFLDAHRLYRAMGFVEQGTRELHDSNHSIEYGFELWPR
jgi:putative acetyltransferase